MNDVMTTVIVRNTIIVQFREICRRMGKMHLAGMFTTALSATGNLPATHWISSGLIGPDFIESMLDGTKLRTKAAKGWVDDGETFPYTQTQINNFLSANCTVSDGTRTVTVNGVPTVVPEGPHELIARLGLKIIIIRT